MALEITQSTVNEIPVFHLDGELDIYTVPRFSDRLDAALHQADIVAVDLREVSLVDSSGLGALLRLAQATSGEPRTVFLVVRGAAIPRLLELTKLADRFDVVDSLDAVRRDAAPV